MAPDIRLGVVLFGSIALWSPALAAFLAGGLDPGAVAWRYAASLAATWTAVTVLSTLVRGYQAEPDDGAGDSTTAVGRRADDPAARSAESPGDVAVEGSGVE